jgi:hypothetical protein
LRLLPGRIVSFPSPKQPLFSFLPKRIAPFLFYHFSRVPSPHSFLSSSWQSQAPIHWCQGGNGEVRTMQKTQRGSDLLWRDLK